MSKNRHGHWHGYTTHLAVNRSASSVKGLTSAKFKSARQQRRELKRIEEKQNAKAND